MLYQDYKKKVNKFVQVLKFIGKYKIAIISALATIIVLITSFAITKGVVYGEKLKLKDIEYGSKPVLDAEAIFSDVVYEFARKGSDNWTTTVPTKPGEYKMRIVTNGLFGTRYSDEQSFSIVPKTITVSTVEDAIVYGENPSVTADLAFSDTVSCDGFVYEDTTILNTKVTPDKSKITITDKKGRDVTSNYVINVATKPISFAKRDVIITVGSEEHVYDGKPFDFPYAAALDGGLVFGDNVVTMVYPDGEEPLVNVGSKVNNGIIFIMRGTVDVTHQYNITVIPGTIKLNVRPLIVEIGSKDFVYDGTAHSYPEFTYDSEATPLPSDHTLMINPLSTPSTVTTVNEGKVDNVLDLRVYNKDGADVTSNFAITILPVDGAKIWITKRKTYVKTQDASFVYNGAEQSAEGHIIVDENGDEIVEGTETENSLLDGHVLVAVEKTTVKNVATGVENVVEYKVIDTKNGDADVTDNYEIVYTYGTIDVAKKTVLFLSDSSTDGIYDGNAHKAEGFTYPDEDKMLCEGHTVEVTYNNSVTDCDTDPESKGVENVFSVVIKDENGDDSVMDNYEIIMENGWLKLNPRPISIITSSDNKIYDGTALTKEAFTYAEGSLEIAEGQTVKYIDATELINVIINEDMTVGSCENIFEIEIYQGEEEKTFNYVITYGYGTLRVDKRPITVTSLGFADKVYYDGEKHRNDGDDAYVVTPADGLDFAIVDGQIIRIKFAQDSFVMLADPIGNNKENEFHVVGIFDGETDMAYNYEITTVFGILTLEKRPVQFASGTLGANEVKYDGLPHSKEESSVAPFGENNMGLVSGHTYVDAGYGAIINVKDSGMDNVFTVSDILDAEGLSVILNYDITGYFYGTLSISPRELTLESLSGEKLYDGTALRVEGLIVGGDKEASGQTLEGHSYKEITDVQVDKNGNAIAVDNTFSYTVYDNETGDAIDPENYVVINYIYGTLKLNKRKITLTSQSAHKTYDNTPIYNTVLVISGEDGLAPGHRVNGINFTAFTDVLLDSNGDVMSAYNRFDYVIVWDDDSETPVNDNNYEVTKVEAGILTVYKRPVTVTVGSKNKIYDGTAIAITSADVTWTSATGYTNEGLLPEHTVVYDVLATLTKAGKIENVGSDTPCYIYYYDTLGAAQSKIDDYDVSFLYGALEVTKRPISLDLREQEKEYDGEFLYPEFDNSDVSYFGNSALAGIVDGDVITLQFDGTAIAFPGTVAVRYYQNVLSYTITNAEGEDVSGCYEIMEALDGSLTVKKRFLKITVNGNYKEYYDGAPIRSTRAVVDNLLESRHTVSYAISGSRTDVGSSYATIVEGSVVIRQIGNNVPIDIDRFYDFAYDDEHIVPGELIVEKQRTVTIKAPSGAFPYDGLAHNSDVEVKTDCEIIDHIALLGFPMMRAEDFDIRFNNVEMKNLGTYENNIVIPVEVYVSGTDVRTTDNYIINVEKGTVTIGKIEIIKLETLSGSKEFDGTPLTNPSVIWESKEAIPSSIEVIITATGTITNAGSVENGYTVSVKVDGVELSAAEAERLLTVEPEGVELGTLTVTPIVINITSADIDKWYVGVMPDYNTNPDTVWKYYSDWASKPDFELAITPNMSIVRNVGENDNDFAATLTYKGAAVDSGNYTINRVFGKVYIYVPQIKVYTESNERIYDGVARRHTVIQYVDGLPNGQDVLASNFKYFLDATTGEENTCDIEVEDSFTGASTTMYYEEIIVVPGKIVIKPRTITIGVPNIIQSYEESTVVRATNEIYDINGDIAALNRVSYLVDFAYQLDVDMSTLFYTETVGEKLFYKVPEGAFRLVRTENGVPEVFDDAKMAQNFIINYEDGYLLLTNNLIKIIIKGHSFVYDGTWKSYKNSDFGVSRSQLPAGYACVIDVEGVVGGVTADLNYIGMKNAGSVDLSAMLEYLISSGRLKVYNGSGEDVTDDFTFVFTGYKGEVSPLTVEQRKITITAGSKTEYYKQGSVLKCEENDYKVTGALVTGDEIVVCKVGGSLSTVGTSKTYISEIIIKNASGEDVTSNYNIEEIRGTLTFVENDQG